MSIQTQAETLANIVKHHTRYLDKEDLTMYMGPDPEYCNEVQQVLFDKLRRCGFTILGTGNFSSVWKHKMLPEKVIKITMTNDEGYHTWAKECYHWEGEKSPIIPNVYYIGESDLFKFYVLDELEPFVLHEDMCDSDLRNLILEDDEELYNRLRLLQGVYLYEALEGVYDEGRQFMIDIHEYNVMLDKNGNMVLTDPLA